MNINKYIGAANVKVGLLDASDNPKALTDLGEVPVVEINPSAEHAESFSTSKDSPNFRDLDILIKPDLSVALTLSQRQLLALSIAAFGETSSEIAGSYTGNAAFPTGIVAGETYEIPGDHVGISTLVIKDSAGSPVTVGTTKYSVNADAPLVTFLDVAGFTQPFTAFSYAYVAADKLTIMTKQPAPMCVIVDGKNLVASSAERWYTKLFKLSFKTANKLGIKGGSDQGTGNSFDLFELTAVPLKATGKSGFGVQRIY